MSDLQKKIDRETEQAREVCNTEGANSGKCAAAWDVVEELQAEASHQKQNKFAKKSLEKHRQLLERLYSM